MIADMISYKKLHPVFTKLIIWGRKVNIALVVIAVILSSAKGRKRKHFVITKIQSRRNLHEIATNH